MNSRAALPTPALVRGAPDSPSIFREPFSDYSASALLAHYRTRDTVQYFPVPDPQETQRAKIDAILDNQFRFNNEMHKLPDPIDWSINPSSDIEWHILLHKFYYAVGLGMAFQNSLDTRYLDKWIALTSSWMEQTAPGFIASDVTGRRIQNWIYAHYYFVTCNTGALVPPKFYQMFLKSMHQQVNYLCAHLAPARNHRTLELYSIFLAAAVFPEMRDAPAWLEFSLPRITENVLSDLLPDGVQRELSTEYHHIVLKNYLCVRRLAQLNGISVSPEIDERLIKALEFSVYAHKPDGVVPALSDGDAQSYPDLLRQGHELYGREDMLFVATKGDRGAVPAARSKAFPDCGYYIMRSGWGDKDESYENERYLIFDCGPLGDGNHGHFDALSFEMAAYGKSLIVDPGRYTYDEAGDINWRVRFRGTDYHNTVQVDRRNQTRYVPGKNRYKVQGLPPACEVRDFVSHADFDFVHGVARSYEYEAVHERRIFFIDGAYWVVSDVLRAEKNYRYDVRFHLSEQACGRAEIHHQAETCAIESPGLTMAHAEPPNTATEIDDGFVSYRYGEKHAAPIVRITRYAQHTAFHTVLFPYSGNPPRIDVRRIPVNTHENLPTNASVQAVRINIDHAGERYSDLCFFAPRVERAIWHFDGYRFNGSFLLLRQDAGGKVLKFHASAGAELQKSGRRIMSRRQNA